MDVKAVTSKKQLCNIEVQRSGAGTVLKRARYNSGLLDANTAKTGEAYQGLPELYVINDYGKGSKEEGPPPIPY